MKLWLLKQILPPDLDENISFIIRAFDEVQARELACEQAADETAECWLNEQYSSCEEVRVSGVPEVILRDFNAG